MRKHIKTILTIVLSAFLFIGTVNITSHVYAEAGEQSSESLGDAEETSETTSQDDAQETLEESPESSSDTGSENVDETLEDGSGDGADAEEESVIESSEGGQRDVSLQSQEEIKEYYTEKVEEIIQEPDEEVFEISGNESEENSEPVDQTSEEVSDTSDVDIPELKQYCVDNNLKLVAVIDTGVSEEYSSYRINFTDEDDEDLSGHGTLIAKHIIENADGKAVIMSLKAFTSTGKGTIANVMKALQYAEDQQVDIINMSFSTARDENNEDKKTFESYCTELAKNGITLVVAAGNNSMDSKYFLPASAEGVISVGAVTSENVKQEKSNYGAKYYEIADTTSEAAGILTGRIASGSELNEEKEREVIIYDSESTDTTIEDSLHISSDDSSSSSTNKWWYYWNYTIKQASSITDITISSDGVELPYYMVLRKYTGTETTVSIPSSDAMNGLGPFTVVLGYNTSSSQTSAKVDTGTIENLTVNCKIVNGNCLFLGNSKLKTIKFNNSNVTTNVTDMFGMFAGCSSLISLDLKNFDTSSVTNMDGMFVGCSSLTSLNLQNISTSKVTDMAYMFEYCTNLTELDLSGFDTNNVTTMYGMFDGCSNLMTIYASILFNTNNVTNSTNMFLNCSNLKNYNSSYYDKTKAISITFGGYLTFVDDIPSSEALLKKGQDFNNCIPSETKKVVFTDISMPDGATAIDVSANQDKSVVAWLGINNKDSTTWYVSSRVIEKKIIFNEDCANMFSYEVNITNIEFNNVDTSNVKSMDSMFMWCASLENLDFRNFDTSNVTTMSHMFNRCTTLQTLDLSSFNTTKVTDMSWMFSMESVDSRLTKIDVSGFDTSSVENMSFMFNQCKSLIELDVSSFDTSKVTTMFCMFDNCNNIRSLDVGNFDTSNVTNMNYMLTNCYGLNSLALFANKATSIADSNYAWTKPSSDTSFARTLSGTTNISIFESLTLSKIKLKKGEIFALSDYKTYSQASGDDYTGNWTAFSEDNHSHGSDLTADISYNGNSYVSLQASYASITDEEWKANPDGIWFVWEKKGTTTYTISYNLNNGTLDNAPTSYTQTDAAISIAAPEKSGYRFTSWSENISTTDWTNGYINEETGENETNETYPNSVYSEKILLKKYSMYSISGTSLGSIRLAVYSTDGTYLGSTTEIKPYIPDQDVYVSVVLCDGCTKENRNAMTIFSLQYVPLTISTGSTGNRTYTANFEKLYTLTVVNAVQGNGGNKAKDFEFDLSYRNSENWDFVLTLPDGSTQTIGDGQSLPTFSLKNGEQATMSNLTYYQLVALKAKLQQVSFASEGYETVFAYDRTTETYLIINTKTIAVPTGNHNNDAYLWLTLIGIAGIVGFVLSRTILKQS